MPPATVSPHLGEWLPRAVVDAVLVANRAPEVGWIDRPDSNHLIGPQRRPRYMVCLLPSMISYLYPSYTVVVLVTF